MQFYAPLVGATVGEYFRDTGRPALIIFDDLLSKLLHTESFVTFKKTTRKRGLSWRCVLLHSRLLEESKIINDDKIASQMNDLPDSLKDKVKGGGSLALPIIETQAGDVSAYIPTNVISITDGQIFLESNLFLSGVRPAINVGISVSELVNVLFK